MEDERTDECDVLSVVEAEDALPRRIRVDVHRVAIDQRLDGSAAVGASDLSLYEPAQGLLRSEE